MIRTIRKFKFWEMPNAIPHEVKVDYDSVWGCYDVMVDNTLYCTTTTENEAIGEIITMTEDAWWTAVYPYGEVEKRNLL